MIKTGAAGFLDDFIADATLPFGVTATMAALALLTILLTQSIRNAAAGLTALPATGITHSGPRQQTCTPAPGDARHRTVRGAAIWPLQ